MKYRESQLDKDLRKRFANDNAHAILRTISLKEGTIRGLSGLDITFDYPITAIAGKNGAGKSTILALACCAYHNKKDGFKLPKRNNPYYTFSDFFIQHADEVSPEGIEIWYSIAYNNWKKSPSVPTGIGTGWQRRSKKKGGKWNNYDERVKKNVVFLGIERIVPHSERSQSRSYSRAFHDTKSKGWEEKVKEDVGFVLDRRYERFRYLEYSKYNLPIVKVGSTIYSGFNMGAGENALFEIFSTIRSCGQGSLLVLDEIELGLHAEAQLRLIERLKKVCYDTHTQVICTTHSREIFDSLPPYARIFIEKIGDKIEITNGISSDLAFAKLAATSSSNEVEILVEDDISRAILTLVLPTEIRSRVEINLAGSVPRLTRRLADTYAQDRTHPFIVVFDGDQRSKYSENHTYAKSVVESHGEDFQTWFNSHIEYLPGNTWPEFWLVKSAIDNCIPSLARDFSCKPDYLKEILEQGLRAGGHNEFFEIAKRLNMGKDICFQQVAISVIKTFPEDFKPIISHIEQILKDNN
ncbi:MAG: ATP-dependent nuclease [bacterium]